MILTPEFAFVVLFILAEFVLFSVVKLHIITAWVSVLWCPLRVLRKNYVRSVIVFVEGWCFIYVICMYLRILQSNTISISDDVSVNSTTTGVTCGARTAYPFRTPKLYVPYLHVYFVIYSLAFNHIDKQNDILELT